MTIKKLVFMVLIGLLTIILLFVGMMLFSWRSDISNKKPYSSFLNISLEVKRASIITTIPVSNRFEKYNLTDSYSESIKEETTKKSYNVGDTIQFYAAKSFYNMHIGTSYHLLGREILKSGEVVDFEYCLSEYSPRIWENLEDFLARKKQEKK